MNGVAYTIYERTFPLCSNQSVTYVGSERGGGEL